MDELNKSELSLGFLSVLILGFKLHWWALPLGIICSLLWAMGGAGFKTFRRLGVPLAVSLATGVAWNMIGVFPLLLGDGLPDYRPDTYDEGSWLGSKNSEGYGTFYFNNRTDSAHRVSYIINQGRIKFGLCVLHSCDNPPCVNPLHLFLGTKQDNANDAKAKGRTMIFQSNAVEKNPACKLTQKKVNSIRSEFKPRIITRKMLAKKYDISWQTISDILYGQSWRRV